MVDKYYYKYTEKGRPPEYTFIIGFVLLSDQEAEKVRAIIEKCDIWTTHLGSRQFSREEAEKIIEILNDNEKGIYDIYDQHYYFDLLKVDLDQLRPRSAGEIRNPIWYSNWLKKI